MDRYPEPVIKYACGDLYSAGTDTVHIALKTMVLAMITYPEVQARAHAELDSVLCDEKGELMRLPTFEE